jgi:hypothetical protein
MTWLVWGLVDILALLIGTAPYPPVRKQYGHHSNLQFVENFATSPHSRWVLDTLVLKRSAAMLRDFFANFTTSWNLIGEPLTIVDL